MDKYDGLELVIIFFIFFGIAYSKSLWEFGVSFAGRWFLVCVIVYFTMIGKYYGLAAAAAVVMVSHYAHSEEWFWREGFDKATHCDRGVLKYKGSVVKPEMAAHVYPEILYRHPEHRCNPCDNACSYTTVNSNIIATEETLLRNNKDPSTPETTPLSSALEYWIGPVASLGVFTEPFSYL